MDRGVKIAIFIASVVSLSLGLIWDQVLSKARVMVEKPVQGPMDAEVMNARVGSPDIERLEIVRAIDAAREAVPGGPQAPQPTDTGLPPSPAQSPDAAPDAGWSEYTVAQGEGWWDIAHKRFKGRGLSSTDIQSANPQVTGHLQPGMKVKIPPPKVSVSTGQ